MVAKELAYIWETATYDNEASLDVASGKSGVLVIRRSTAMKTSMLENLKEDTVHK
jgi:hypothetical protein